MIETTDTSAEPACSTHDCDDLRPRSPGLLVLADHGLVAERTRAVAAALARVLVTRTLSEMGVLVTNDNMPKDEG